MVCAELSARAEILALGKEIIEQENLRLIIDLFFSPIRLHLRPQSKADCKPNQLKLGHDKPYSHSSRLFR
jgi:hypothetical protein